MQQSLFEKYGGFAKISKIVLKLYDRVLDDDDLGPFFESVDMSRIVDHQTKFVSSLLGGPVEYSDEQIKKMHRHLSISDEHFQRLSEILADTLREHSLAAEDVRLVVEGFQKRRHLVVS